MFTRFGFKKQSSDSTILLTVIKRKTPWLAARQKGILLLTRYLKYEAPISKIHRPSAWVWTVSDCMPSLTFCMLVIFRCIWVRASSFLLKRFAVKYQWPHLANQLLVLLAVSFDDFIISCCGTLVVLTFDTTVAIFARDLISKATPKAFSQVKVSVSFESG